MPMGIMPQYKTSLARGAAILLIGSLAAGCSVANLTDGLTTNSTAAPVAVARSNQPYPGDVRIIRPKAEVGGGGILQSSSAATSLPPPAAPTYSAATYSAPASSAAISSAPLPPPGGGAQQASAPTVATPAEQPRQVAMVPQAPRAQEPSRPSGAASGGSYVVASGDTLYGIARKTGASVSALKEANGLADGSIRIGQKLVVPGGTTMAAAASPAAKPEQVKAFSAPAVKVVEAPKPTPEPVVVASAPKPEVTEEPKVVAYTPPTESKPKAVEAVEQTQVAALPPEATGVGRLR